MIPWPCTKIIPISRFSWSHDQLYLKIWAHNRFLLCRKSFWFQDWNGTVLIFLHYICTDLERVSDLKVQGPIQFFLVECGSTFKLCYIYLKNTPISLRVNIFNFETVEPYFSDFSNRLAPFWGYHCTGRLEKQKISWYILNGHLVVKFWTKVLTNL